jgi:type IV secretion system protein VirB9
MKIKLVLNLLAMSLAASSYLSPAYALREPKPVMLDHRVRTVMYQKDEVYKYTGHYRFQTSIEFGQDEEIKTISMGDSTAWMLNPSGNRLFLKPIEQDATTNMTIITNKRIYLFELHARETDDIDDKDMTFIMRFLYPDELDEVDAQNVTSFLDSVPIPELDENPEKYNFKYEISGSDNVAPIKIFDDGQFTFFLFKDLNADVPAFYITDDRGNEALVNYRTRGDYIVLERVAKRLTLRHGTDIVCVFNNGPIPVGLPAEALEESF